jgi:hypothetical protein
MAWRIAYHPNQSLAQNYTGNIKNSSHSPIWVNQILCAKEGA